MDIEATRSGPTLKINVPDLRISKLALAAVARKQDGPGALHQRAQRELLLPRLERQRSGRGFVQFHLLPAESLARLARRFGKSCARSTAIDGSTTDGLCATALQKQCSARVGRDNTASAKQWHTALAAHAPIRGTRANDLFRDGRFHVHRCGTQAAFESRSIRHKSPGCERLPFLSPALTAQREL